MDVDTTSTSGAWRPMPNKKADRLAQGWRKTGHGWIYDPEGKLTLVAIPKSPKPTPAPEAAQQVIKVRVVGDHMFKPGHRSPGRPKGSKNKLKQQLIDNVGGILDKMIAMALEGDAAAAALVVNRVLPTLRPQSELVQFTLHVDQSSSKQVEQVLFSISRGEVAADVGKKIIEAIMSLANIREVEDLAKRIEALEGRQL